MAITINAKGTSVNSFTIGKQGPLLKNNAGVIELRNSNDSGFANFQSLGIDDNATETVITIDIDETVQLYRNQADAAELLTLIQDHISATGDVIAIGNDGTGDSIQIVNTGNSRGLYISNAGNANSIQINTSDFIVANNGVVSVGGKFNLPQYTVAALPSGAVGDVVYCSDGDAGSPCLAAHNGTDWKVVAFGATVSAV